MLGQYHGIGHEGWDDDWMGEAWHHDLPPVPVPGAFEPALAEDPDARLANLMVAIKNPVPILYPDVEAYEKPANPMIEDPIADAVRVATAEVLREGYEPTESSMQAAAAIIAERQAGGSGDTAWQSWLARVGEAGLTALPQILDRVFSTGQSRTAQVGPRTTQAGMGWGTLLLIGGVVIVVASLLGGRRVAYVRVKGGRRAPSRARRAPRRSAGGRPG